MKIVISILLAVILLIGATAWLGYSTIEQAQQQYGQNQRIAGTQQNNYPPFETALRVGVIQIGTLIHSYREEITAVSTLFIAAFTVIVAIATYFLYSATRSLVVSAENVAQKQLARSEDIERAYMSAGGSRQPPRALTPDERTKANLGPPPSGTDYFIPSEWFQFDVNNHGKTPGEILEYGYGWCEADKVAYLPKFPEYRWVEFRDQIGPGTQSRGIKQIKIPQDKPVIFGRIGYKDIFGKRHSHSFMQEIGKPIAPPHSSYTETDPLWDVPHVGNRQDRNYQEEEPQS